MPAMQATADGYSSNTDCHSFLTKYFPISKSVFHATEKTFFS